MRPTCKCYCPSSHSQSSCCCPGPKVCRIMNIGSSNDMNNFNTVTMHVKNVESNVWRNICPSKVGQPVQIKLCIPFNSNAKCSCCNCPSAQFAHNAPIPERDYDRGPTSCCCTKNHNSSHNNAYDMERENSTDNNYHSFDSYHREKNYCRSSCCGRCKGYNRCIYNRDKDCNGGRYYDITSYRDDDIDLEDDGNEINWRKQNKRRYSDCKFRKDEKKENTDNDETGFEDESKIKRMKQNELKPKESSNGTKLAPAANGENQSPQNPLKIADSKNDGNASTLNAQNQNGNVKGEVYRVETTLGNRAEALSMISSETMIIPPTYYGSPQHSFADQIPEVPHQVFNARVKEYPVQRGAGVDMNFKCNCCKPCRKQRLDRRRRMHKLFTDKSPEDAYLLMEQYPEDYWQIYHAQQSQNPFYHDGPCCDHIRLYQAVSSAENEIAMPNSSIAFQPDRSGAMQSSTPTMPKGPYETVTYNVDQRCPNMLLQSMESRPIEEVRYRSPMGHLVRSKRAPVNRHVRHSYPLRARK